MAPAAPGVLCPLLPRLCPYSVTPSRFQLRGLIKSRPFPSVPAGAEPPGDLGRAGGALGGCAPTQDSLASGLESERGVPGREEGSFPSEVSPRYPPGQGSRLYLGV